jgi:hypothetical protein
MPHVEILINYELKIKNYEGRLNFGLNPNSIDSRTGTHEIYFVENIFHAQINLSCPTQNH